MEEHHIFGGTANRRKSERYGLTVLLCGESCHRNGTRAAHRCKETALALHQYGQRKYSQISLLRAAEINEAAKAAMDTLPERPEVFRSALNSDYNYTDTETKTYRYQAVYDITF